VPQVADASFKDWGDDPFGGGWNSWNIGVRSSDVKRADSEAKGGRSVVYLREAYSDFQDWVEGSLQSANMMLELYFQIAPMAAKAAAKASGR
jgi:hypothetical protein